LYASDHPYHWPTIGDVADLQAATMDDVSEFFRTYYHPANASLALAGDISNDRALALARQYFGEIPAGPVPAPVRGVAALDTEARLVIEDRVELPRLVAWHSPAMFADGDADLDVAGDVLAGGKSSTLPDARVRSWDRDRRVGGTKLARDRGSFR
jgi:zinc protease